MIRFVKKMRAVYTDNTVTQERDSCLSRRDSRSQVPSAGIRLERRCSWNSGNDFKCLPRGVPLGV